MANPMAFFLTDKGYKATQVESDIKLCPLLMYSTTTCRYCKRARRLMDKLDLHPKVVELDEQADEANIRQVLSDKTKQMTVPNMFLLGKHVGGSNDLFDLFRSGQLYAMLKAAKIPYKEWVEPFYSFGSITHLNVKTVHQEAPPPQGETIVHRQRRNMDELPTPFLSKEAQTVHNEAPTQQGETIVQRRMGKTIQSTPEIFDYKYTTDIKTKSAVLSVTPKKDSDPRLVNVVKAMFARAGAKRTAIPKPSASAGSGASIPVADGTDKKLVPSADTNKEHDDETEAEDKINKWEMPESNRSWYIQEKIDGSQFSFRVMPNGQLLFYNKHKQRTLDAKTPEKEIFVQAMRAIQELHKTRPLSHNYTYHGEAIERPKHNVVSYARTPKHFVMVYDIQDEFGDFLWPHEIEKECKRVDLECVAVLYHNETRSFSSENVNVKKSIVGNLQSQLQDKKAIVTPQDIVPHLVSCIANGHLNSCLGSDTKYVAPEGMVVKHPTFRTGRKNGTETVALKQKFVTDVFKESHRSGSKIKAGSRTPTEFLRDMGLQYANDARRHKAVQHLQESDPSFLESDLRPFSPKTENWERNQSIYTDELDRDLLKEYKKSIVKQLLNEFMWYMKPMNTREPVQDPYFPLLLRLQSEPAEWQPSLIVGHFLLPLLALSR